MMPENKMIRITAMVEYLWKHGHLDDLPDWIKSTIKTELEA